MVFGKRVDTAREVVGGATTFFTMAYIIFVQPAVLTVMGMDFGAVMTATCLASAAGTLLMAFLANYPIAMAPAMGHNFFVVYTVSLGMGVPWQTCLALNLISGLLFVATASLRMRVGLLHAVPDSLKNAIAAGIGLLIAVVGMRWAGLLRASSATFAELGDLHSPVVLLSVGGLIVSAVLVVLRVTGALLIGMLVTLAFGLLGGHITFQGVIGSAPSLAPTFLAFDLKSALDPKLIGVMLTLFFLDVFDTIGTLVGVGKVGGFLRRGKFPRSGKALFADAVATVIGACLGTTTVSSYIESSAGVSAGARTGLANVVTAAGFLLALFFHPLVKMVAMGVPGPQGEPLYPVTAPALILVGVLMTRVLAEISWDDLTEAVPAFLTLLVMPLTLSITEGIAFGFVSYCALKFATGRQREVPRLLWVITALILLGYFLI